jgi:acetyl-CoA carboxylase carboxyl transferase subunit alpha
MRHLGLIDEIVKEPAGGAHLDYAQAATLVDEAIHRHLTELSALAPAARLDARYAKFRAMGSIGVTEPAPSAVPAQAPPGVSN